MNDIRKWIQDEVIGGANELPDISRVLTEWGPMPTEAIVLGVASDGLPVMLNRRDPLPGSILIAGDDYNKRMDFLYFVTVVVSMLFSPAEVQIVMISKDPARWDRIRQVRNVVAVVPSYKREAEDFLLSLSSWAHHNSGKQTVLLLVDDLDSMTKMDFDPLQYFHWLLSRGPKGGVFPIVALDTCDIDNVRRYIEMFNTRIFSKIKDGDVRVTLEANEISRQGHYTIREGSGWCEFWLPRIA